MGFDSIAPHGDTNHAVFALTKNTDADDIQQIQGAIAFAQQEKVKLVIIGGADAPLCADLIKKYDIPVIITGTQRLPQRRYSGYDDQFTLPNRLRELGILSRNELAELRRRQERRAHPELLGRARELRALRGPADRGFQRGDRRGRKAET